jgi:hypothetical protein
VAGAPRGACVSAPRSTCSDERKGILELDKTIGTPPAPEVGPYALGAEGAAGRLERGADARPEGRLGVGPRQPHPLREAGALGYGERLADVSEPHRRARLPGRLAREAPLLAGQRARAWCFWDVRHRQGLGEPDLARSAGSPGRPAPQSRQSVCPACPPPGAWPSRASLPPCARVLPARGGGAPPGRRGSPRRVEVKIDFTRLDSEPPPSAPTYIRQSRHRGAPESATTAGEALSCGARSLVL